MAYYEFKSIKDAPLIIDSIYKGGISGNAGDDPLSKMFEGIGNMGGFRISYNRHTKEPAFVILYTSGTEIEWPDKLDVEMGVFRYFGDNRSSGKELHDTKKGGNLLLKKIFNYLHSNKESERKKIPPILIFRKHVLGRDVQFLGLAVPGVKNSEPHRDLIAIWKSDKNGRFQNYEAYFTILSITGGIDKKWFSDLRNERGFNHRYAPVEWRNFIKFGLEGIKPLKADPVRKFRNKNEQLPDPDSKEFEILQSIHEEFSSNPFKFERFAVEIIQKMDDNFKEFKLTPPRRDGGRDAIGTYSIGIYNNRIDIQCSLEAKCYNPGKNSVGVKELSRLISRIRNKEFGILVTTSFVGNQAYNEIISDGHPILIISGGDIIQILKKSSLYEKNVLQEWIKTILESQE